MFRASDHRQRGPLHDRRITSRFDLRSLDPSMIAAVEFYTVATTPSEFNRGGNALCGPLLIWLQN
jgi:hypothetical protein